MKIGITGINGFIGSALATRLKLEGHVVYNYLRQDLDILFLFGSPSSNLQFDQAPWFCWNQTVSDFYEAIRFCRDHNIKLIYPSSGTIYNPVTNYARCKLRLEEMQKDWANEYGNILGLRIFACYGPGEGHKGEYASVIYKWCKQMKAGARPVVWGNGEQTRDFIYIDDCIEAIIQNIDKTGVIDIGTGISLSFNQVIQRINDLKPSSRIIKPIYINKPDNYIEETICKNPVPCKFDMIDGINRILESL